MENIKATPIAVAESVIRSAMTRAAVADFSQFNINFRHPNYHTDKRRGHIHGWSSNREYLGSFPTHSKAIQTGARFFMEA